MNLFEKIFLNNKQKVAQSKLTLNEELYLEKGSSLVCKDSINGSNNIIKIVPNHIDLDLDTPIEEPEFNVYRITSRDGVIGMYAKKLLTLDTDNTPTENSTKMITSGTLYTIINDLQEQINDLKNKIK